MQAFVPDWPGLPPNVRVLSTVRTGGVSLPPYDDGAGGGGFNLGMHVGDDPVAVMHNRALLRSLLPGEPKWLHQVHGTTVVRADEVRDVPAADASMTTQPGAVCIIQTADCLPVLFSDTAGKVVSAAHAGWRGLAGGILERTIDAMRDAGAEDIVAWMGPAIGPGCFEVGDDVRNSFLQQSRDAGAAFAVIAEKQGKYLADIYHLARLALLRHGIRNVSGGQYCTVSDAQRFYSYRRDKTTGRMASMIWIDAH